MQYTLYVHKKIGVDTAGSGVLPTPATLSVHKKIGVDTALGYQFIFGVMLYVHKKIGVDTARKMPIRSFPSCMYIKK